MSPQNLPRDERRGNYSMLMGSLLVVVVGFSAFSVDISLITMAELQVQSTTDAAAHAALVTFQKNFSVSEGNSAAGFIVNYDKVAMGTATIDPGYPQYGTYDFDLRTFSPGLAADGSANAVRVKSSRVGGNAVQLLLAPMLGVNKADVTATSISAQETRAVMLVQDMSCSMMDLGWNGSKYYSLNQTSSAVNMGRIANLAFLDYFWTHPQDGDMMGLTMFGEFANVAPTNGAPYGARANSVNQAPWLPLVEVATNYTPIQTGINGICNTFAAQPCPLSGANHPVAYKPYNQYYQSTWPTSWDIGSCTNPDPAMDQAIEQLKTTDDSYFRGMLFFSDGVPNCGTGFAGGGSATTRAYARADEAWANDIHIWTVLYHNGSFNPSFMSDLVRGVGYYQGSQNPADLPEMYESVGESIQAKTVY